MIHASQNDHSEISSNFISKKFEPLIQSLYKEAKKNNQYFYGNLKFGGCSTYEDIKCESTEFKIGLILYLPKVIADEWQTIRQIDNWKKTEIRRELNTVRDCLLSALLRTKISFTEGDLIQLMNIFRKESKGEHQGFSNWPIGFTVSQISKFVKSHNLSVTLRSSLENILKWPEFDSKKGHWGSDIQKAKIRLEEVLFDNSGSQLVSPPYKMSTEDKFGVFVNEYISELSEEHAQYWHLFLHHAVKAATGKPSKKYLATSKNAISEIGNEKFKSFINRCLEFVRNLKADETVRVQNWSGEEYRYSTWVFLEEKNALVLKGMVWSLVHFFDSKTLAALGALAERCFQKIPGVGPAAAGVGNAAIYVLAHSRGLEGVSHLSRLKLKITQNNTKKLIQKYLDEASQKLNITTEEIEEISIPDFGLTNGQKKISFEDYFLAIEVIGVGRTKMSWIKPNGESQKSPPAFIKQSTKLTQLLKKSKDEIKQIQKYSTAQRDRIDRSFILNRTWNLGQFEKYYHNHGLVSTVSRNLIWVFSENGKNAVAHWHKDKWQDVNSKNITPSENMTVQLWHPIQSDTSTVLAWREKLDEHKLQQPLKQAYREIYLLTDAELNTKIYSNRMAAHILKQHQFNSLTAIRNWKYQLMGAFDDGRENEVASLALPKWGLTAEYWINEVYMDNAMNDTGIWDYVATDQLKFINEQGNAKDLIDIPKIVLSEVMRDADLFVGVSSVGNDPAWQDSGGERINRYGDYWIQYSFGDLNEFAKTRKQVLERLIPRLKIKDLAQVDGKFLRVKGKVREYKIHIGSTNILMEPNDQYLCIVPARGESFDSKNVFLPFEGDKGLSLVISKAFLLAEDDKITDATILSQIKG